MVKRALRFALNFLIDLGLQLSVTHPRCSLRKFSPSIPITLTFSRESFYRLVLIEKIFFLSFHAHKVLTLPGVSSTKTPFRKPKQKWTTRGRHLHLLWFRGILFRLFSLLATDTFGSMTFVEDVFNSARPARQEVVKLETKKTLFLPSIRNI